SQALRAAHFAGPSPYRRLATPPGSSPGEQIFANSLPSTRSTVAELTDGLLKARSDPAVEPHAGEPGAVGDDPGGEDGIEVGEVEEDGEEVGARGDSAGGAAGGAGVAGADDEAEGQGDGDDEVGLEGDGVVVELGALVVEVEPDPGEPAGGGGEEEGAGAPVAAHEPPAQAEGQGG